MPDRPLLVVDGDSFAHRAYHGLPKTILGVGGKPAGAIVGFANFLLRMVEQERPRAVLVGWDTLDVPNYRHKAFPAYQGGRRFDKELLVQLDLLPLLVAACGSRTPRPRGTRLTISSPLRWRTRSGGAEPQLWRAAIATRSNWHPRPR